MARGFSGSLERINFGSGVANLTADWTVGGWFQRRSSGRPTETPLWSRWTDSATNRQLYVYVNKFGSAATDKIQVDVPFIANIMTGTTVFDTITWHHFAVTRSGNSWVLYVDGVAEATAVNAAAQESGGDVTFGDTIATGSGEGDMFGDQAEMAAWNVALSAEDVAQLALGAWPPMVRPDALVFYPALLGANSPENDFVGGNAGVLTGTSEVAHPRMEYPGSGIESEYETPAPTEEPRVITLQGRVDTAFGLQGRDDTRSALQGRDDTDLVLQGSR